MLLAVVLLAACSNDESAAPSGDDVEPAAPAGSDAAPAEDGSTAPTSPERLVVYTSRQPHLVEPLFDDFTEETGIAIDYISDSEAALIERLAAEGDRTPASVLITVDAGNLWQAAERGLLQPIDSDVLDERIPAELRDPDDQWFGLSIRARTLVYHPDRVDPADLSTYQALTAPEWAGRLCLRTSRKVYNQSLVAMMIERLGEERTEQIVAGWLENLATEPFSSDTRLIEAVAAGQCDVGLVNTYYLGRLQKDDPDYPVELFWANQDTSGVHVNISGAGLTTHAPEPAAGRQLIEWMTGLDAQQFIAASNMEYPVVDDVPLDPTVAAWGEFEADSINLRVAGQRQAEAVRLMDRAGWR
ncbi:Fe(3+) ABC transporter substrate-binding protein [Wenzhouxiangella sp. XN79A]|nr:Fe(3+) ABC transporter substrate-binding protein [Wenzhouxiangella sp. XN79A]